VRRRMLVALLMALAVTTASSISADAQSSPQGAVAARDAFEALVAGRIREATPLFEQAIAAAPTDPDLRVGAAFAAYLEGRSDDARHMLDSALALDAKHIGARMLLGRLQRRTGDSVGAVQTYERLAADLPDNKNIAKVLARWHREDALHTQMDQSIGAHFSVAFDGPSEAALAERALASLERAYDRIGDVLLVYPVTPIPVVLYSQRQFRDITRSPSWAGGAYDGIIRVPVRGALDQEAELDRVLSHEFVHALVATMTTRRLPTWFNEGLAGALETDDVGWAHRVVEQLPEPIPLEALIGSFSEFSGDEADGAYAVSALAIHRLLETAGGVAVANLLRDLDDGASFEAAFAHRMPVTIKQFEAEWDAR